MFERRLKIFLFLVSLVAAALVLRAAQIQVVQRNEWKQRAAETMKRSQLIETFRGKLLDYRGRPVAVDAPCVDACVDYRVIGREPNEAWVLREARNRLRENLGAAYTQAPVSRQKALRAQEIERVKADIERMWGKLAALSGKSIHEIDDIRQGIVNRVTVRRRYIWYRKYELARRRHESQLQEPGAFWRRWLIDETQDAPELNDFMETVSDEEEAHVILRNINVEAQTELGKYIERYPGLVLRPSTYRYYPYANAGCHLVGRLSRVNKEDLEKDPNVGVNELRQYLPNDLIGRTGVEALAEPMLRGSRGRIERLNGREVENETYQPGRDVRLTFDVELQQEIQKLFAAVEYKDRQGNIIETTPMHGAAVVIDVPTGGVRALASYPDFDPNKFDEQFPILNADDNLSKPLLNRATQSQLEPGSTVKPIAGMAAIAEGLIGVDEGIECTGYLVINGRAQRHGRCWVASKFHETLCHSECRLFPCPTVAHHPVPGHSPHETGFLTYADALERSCNVYFETLADRLGLDLLSEWYGRFGLGRPTGIGISEVSGRLPNKRDRAGRLAFSESERQGNTWFAGIGQGPVAATPLQMANVAATIARDGVWMRPRLLEEAGFRPPGVEGPEQVNLDLPSDALAALKEGMVRVVNSKAGTGTVIQRPDVLLAGKTGTAQAARLWIPMLDTQRRPVLDEKGRPRRHFLELSTKENPNPLAPWYRGTGAENKERNHAWFIGFAPAENPRIAFAVLVEYGGSGGAAAAGIAQNILEACVEHGYLPLNHQTASLSAADSPELLRDVIGNERTQEAASRSQ